MRCVHGENAISKRMDAMCLSRDHLTVRQTEKGHFQFGSVPYCILLLVVDRFNSIGRSKKNVIQGMKLPFRVQLLQPFIMLP